MAAFNNVKLLMVVLATWVIWLPFSCAAQGFIYEKAFAENLSMGPATSLKLSAHGRSSADIDKTLIQI